MLIYRDKRQQVLSLGFPSIPEYNEVDFIILFKKNKFHTRYLYR